MASQKKAIVVCVFTYHLAFSELGGPRNNTSLYREKKMFEAQR